MLNLPSINTRTPEYDEKQYLHRWDTFEEEAHQIRKAPHDNVWLSAEEVDSCPVRERSKTEI